ncbi:MAG: phospho-N-acetylmuramoyl-pentapeptide-transferase [Candidatus Dojkabacteria bacterium]|nr:phospho-N-acetylmuramoyl-pentapeptide-transferase [Candidatus Dojkabacteria bacterium]
MTLFDIFSTIFYSFVFSFVISFPIIHFLYKYKITRRLTNDFSTIIASRSIKEGVPVMGGLIFIISVVFLNIFFNPYPRKESLGLILSMFVISAILGGVDDILNIYGVKRHKPKSLSRVLTLIRVHKRFIKRVFLLVTLPWYAYKSFFYMLGSNPGSGLHAHEKIIVQSIVGLVLGISLYFFTPFSSPEVIKIPVLNANVNIGILLIPFAWMAVLFMSNAVNLGDGMDGLAAGQSIFVFMAFLIIAAVQNDARITFLMATVIGSLIAYLYFNIPPARFQMGDVGSLALGTLMAIVAFILQQPILLMVIAFPFVVTLFSSLIQGIGRRVLGRRVFKMAPIHYHLQIANNWSEEKVVMRLWLFSFLCSIIGLIIYFSS